jgi:hypothetical protein
MARIVVCRNIKTLHNFKPPATADEIRASSLQFVRKLSGFTRPSKANQPAFDRAVDEVARAAHELLGALVTNAPPRDRAIEASKAQARAANRFGSPAARHAT